MNEIFHFVERPYNLRSNYTLQRKQDHTVHHSSESISSLAPKLWDHLPNSIKNSASLKEFKIKINTWAFEHCPCRIVIYGAWMTMFSTNPYFIIIQRFECYTTLTVKELLYNKKSNFLLQFQKVS